MSIINFLIPVIVIMVAIFSVFAFVFIKSPYSVLTKFLMIPLAFVASTSVPTVFTFLLGFAVPLPLPQKFIVLGHNILAKDNKKSEIEVWAKTANETRLYVIPYDPKMEQMLEEAKRGRTKGKQGHMTRNMENNGFAGGESQARGGNYRLNLVDQEDLMPRKTPQDIPIGPQ